VLRALGWGRGAGLRVGQADSASGLHKMRVARLGARAGLGTRGWARLQRAARARTAGPGELGR
jgi:hypothetical protein